MQRRPTKVSATSKSTLIMNIAALSFPSPPFHRLTQFQLLRPWPMLDLQFAFHRFGTGGELFAVDEFDREAHARVFSPAPGVVGFDSCGYIHRPAGIERAIGAADDVDEGHEARIADRISRIVLGKRNTQYAIRRRIKVY